MTDQDFSDKTARKTLKEILKVCEAHDISKEGFIEEIKQGLDPQKDTGKVTTRGNQEVVDLDLEEIAIRGEKRLKLTSVEDLSEVPRKLTEHEMQN